MEKLIEKLAKLMVPLAALGAIAGGAYMCWAAYTGAGGSRLMSRGGLACIGIGIALLAYWALSSENSDYNF